MSKKTVIILISRNLCSVASIIAAAHLALSNNLVWIAMVFLAMLTTSSTIYINHKIFSICPSEEALKGIVADFEKEHISGEKDE